LPRSAAARDHSAVTAGGACVFCAIVARTAEASVVHSDEHVVAFMDIRPVVPGHLLVVPRQHAVGLADLDPEDGVRVFRAAQRLAAALRRSDLPCGGVNLFLADGEVAGQAVFHVHLHVLPRNPADGFRLRFDRRFPSRAELDGQARRIRAGLGLSRGS
jgi:diadenosine tetraphosphate (Ap4A) HIT family hydrolase